MVSPPNWGLRGVPILGVPILGVPLLRSSEICAGNKPGNGSGRSPGEMGEKREIKGKKGEKRGIKGEFHGKLKGN